MVLVAVEHHLLSGEAWPIRGAEYNAERHTL